MKQSGLELFMKSLKQMMRCEKINRYPVGIDISHRPRLKSFSHSHIRTPTGIYTLRHNYSLQKCFCSFSCGVSCIATRFSPQGFTNKDLCQKIYIQVTLDTAAWNERTDIFSSAENDCSTRTCL